MNLREKISQDLKEALRNKEELLLSVLRMLTAAMNNKSIEKRTRLSKSGVPGTDLEKLAELSDDEITEVIRSESKKRRDAIDGFSKGGRQELAEKESQELKILEKYLPQELSDEEVEKIVKEIVANIGVVTIKDFGRVMGEVMKKIKGQASGDKVSAAVKKILGESYSDSREI